MWEQIILSLDGLRSVSKWIRAVVSQGQSSCASWLMYPSLGNHGRIRAGVKWWALGRKMKCVSDIGNGSRMLQRGKRETFQGRVVRAFAGAWTVAVCYKLKEFQVLDGHLDMRDWQVEMWGQLWGGRLERKEGSDHPHSVSRRSDRKLAANRPEPFSFGWRKREQGGEVDMKLTEKQKTKNPGMARPKYRRGGWGIIFKTDHLGSWRREGATDVGVPGGLPEGSFDWVVSKKADLKELRCESTYGSV